MGFYAKSDSHRSKRCGKAGLSCLGLANLLFGQSVKWSMLQSSSITKGKTLLNYAGLTYRDFSGPQNNWNLRYTSSAQFVKACAFYNKTRSDSDVWFSLWDLKTDGYVIDQSCVPQSSWSWYTSCVPPLVLHNYSEDSSQILQVITIIFTLGIKKCFMGKYLQNM